MAREMDFRKLRLGEYTAASSLCSGVYARIRQRFCTVHAAGYRSVQEGLELYYK